MTLRAPHPRPRSRSRAALVAALAAASLAAAAPAAMAQRLPTPDSLPSMRRNAVDVPLGGTVVALTVGPAIAPQSGGGWGLGAGVAVGRIVAPYLQLRGELSGAAFGVVRESILCPPNPTECRQGRSDHPGHVIGLAASAVLSPPGRTPVYALGGIGGALAERTTGDGSASRVLLYGGIGVTGPGALRRLSFEVRSVHLAGGGEPRHSYWPLAVGFTF